MIKFFEKNKSYIVMLVLVIASVAGIVICRNNQNVVGDGFHTLISDPSIDSLTDVDIFGLATDDILQYDGSNWINTVFSGGGSTFATTTNDYWYNNTTGITSSNQITAGTNLTWAGNTLNAVGSMTALPHTNIYVGNSSNEATATSSLTVLDNGNVGIGTTTPSHELSVVGDMYLTGEIINGTLKDEQVILDSIGTPTNTTLDAHLNNNNSAGKYSGMLMTAVDATHISISAGTGLLRTTDDNAGHMANFDIATNTSFAVSIDELNYIYVDYNSGSPIFASTTDESSINRNTQFPIGGVWADGIESPHIINDGVILNNTRTNEQRRMLETRRAEIANGLVIGETGARYLTYTAGVVYIIGEREVFTDVDTSGTDRFKAVYRDGSGGWTIVSDQQQVSNTQYDDGDGGLGNIGVAKYGVFWVYILDDGGMYVQYGQDSYKLSDAQNAGIPATAPELSAIGILAGKIIVLQGATNFLSIESAFDTIFQPQTAVNHNDLGGLNLGDYLHLTAAEYGIVGNTSGTNSGDITLAGTPDYLTLANQVLTRTVLDINDDTNLIGGTGLSFTGDTLNWSSTGLDWTGNVIGDAYITKTGDWTGTLDTYQGADLLNANAGTTGQVAYYAGNGSTVSGTSTINVQGYGGVQIGDYTDGYTNNYSGTSTPILGIQRTLSGLKDTDGYDVGFSNYQILEDGGDVDGHGIYSEINYIENNDTSGDLGELGLYYNVWRNNGIASWSVGEEYDVYNYGTSTILYGKLSTVSNFGHSVTVYGNNQSVNGGGAVDAYAFRGSAVGADNNYGIYISAGESYFAGAVTIGAYTLPNTDGTNGYVLKTDGSGTLTWQTDNNTTYTAGGTLLDLTTGTFSLNEGTLTNGKLCTYVSDTGLVCNTTAGNVSKVGTPLDNQVGVWTGDGTIEGITVGTNGQILLGSTASNPVFGTLNADRSITATVGAGTLEIDADVETYTGKHKIAFETPTATDDFFFGEVKTAQTFKSIYCKTLVGTVTLDVTIAGTDINGTDITCTTAGVLDSTLGGDTSGAVGDEIKLAITSIATAPTYLFLQLNYEYDD